MTTHGPTADQPVRLPEHVELVDTEDGAVLFDQRRGTYWQLNGSGAFAVRHLLDGAGADELTAAIIDRYPVNEDEAAADVRDLLASLHRAGLIRPDGPSRPDGPTRADGPTREA